MYFLFIVENKGEKDKRSNRSMFKLVQKLNIKEENIYFDTDSDDIVYQMLDKMVSGDTLIVKRVDDLAGTLRELIGILEIMDCKSISLYSEEHEGLNGNKYYKALLAAQDLSDSFKERRRLLSYKKSVELGKVGRPKKKKELEIAIKLYKTGKFSIKDIERLSGISSSTLYRNFRKD
jgi:DNA invertase Pin-like site-specific DNA recombinase